ncbi:DUF6665 family protein [Devosia sp. Root635]|uniref:DUF6665 family protein n=1 Tax=Devosia sp. Root635 TaxID=1736575 RepID=UPI0006F4B43B|nr:DUF6665 family protein [Devosia sp. Root635]KRA45615.1 hypothetical protein ASD80_04610 [Devosia sp. Root635]
MSLRDSLDLIRTVKPDAGTSALEYEVMAERAASLGAAEQRVVASIAALAAPGDDRDARLSEARRTVWEYFVQRELVGFRKHNDVIQELNIPREVIAGLGAMPAGKQR